METRVSTPRVQRVRAAALRLVVRQLLNRELTEEQSLELVSQTLLEEAVRRLRRRFSFRRTGYGSNLDTAFEQEVAVQEVVIDLTGVETTRGDALPPVITEAMRRRREATEREKEVQEATKQVEDLLETHKKHSRRIRLFLREVDRVRRRQVMELRLSAAPAGERRRAERELHLIYKKYILRALETV